MESDSKNKQVEVVPSFGRDEMNLAQLAIGPISPLAGNKMRFAFDTFDPVLKRNVHREITISGSEDHGLPKPIDDQVLIAMKALTHLAGYESRRVEFSGYQLCKTIDWSPNGDSYERLEKSLDRILGTTLKFKNAWWDNGEKVWRSDAFHLIDNYGLCSRDEADRVRCLTGKSEFRLSYFVWNEVLWKSLQDGYIKKLDMEMFRRIRKKRRSDVALRLFRILDKRLYKKRVAKFSDLRDLCERQIGLADKYSLSHLKRTIDRAVDWLCECRFLSDVRYGKSPNRRTCSVEFLKYSARGKPSGHRAQKDAVPPVSDEFQKWLAQQTEAELFDYESRALSEDFGSTLVRNNVLDSRKSGTSILEAGRIRQEFIQQFIASLSA